MAWTSARPGCQLCFAAEPLGHRQRTARSPISRNQMLQFSICNVGEVLGDLRKRPAVSDKEAGCNEFEELPVPVDSFLPLPLCAADDASLSIVAEHADI